MDITRLVDARHRPPTIGYVLNQLSLGTTIQDLENQHPALTREEILDCLFYAGTFLLNHHQPLQIPETLTDWIEIHTPSQSLMTTTKPAKPVANLLRELGLGTNPLKRMDQVKSQPSMSTDLTPQHLNAAVVYAAQVFSQLDPLSVKDASESARRAKALKAAIERRHMTPGSRAQVPSLRK